jgi:hypothetical protein
VSAINNGRPLPWHDTATARALWLLCAACVSKDNAERQASLFTL